MRAGQALPDRIANAPELQIGLQLYLQAFFDLDSERSHSMGVTPIPWSSIATYARAFEFDEEQTEDLFYFIRKLDQEHTKKLAEKQKAAAKNGKRPVKPSRKA
ncbi:tail chaperonin [Enterobacteria phage FtMidnight]